jgi:polar amino acid transport system permease protein
VTEFLHYYFNLPIMAAVFPQLMWGLLITLGLAAVTIVGGLALGLLLAVIRAYRIAPLSFLVVVFVDMFRALPPLVIIILVYFGLPYAGITFSPFWCAAITLILVLAAVAEEIFWAGIVSVDKGQWEAARSTGLNFLLSLVFVITPQGILIVIAPLTNKVISITKNTALASVVAVPELLNAGITAQGVYANPTPLTLVAIMYIALFLPLVQLSNHLESRFHYTR